MVATQTEIQSQIMELSHQGIRTFCDDISKMFSVDMTSAPQQQSTETVKELKTRFDSPAAVITVNAEGQLKGNFYFVFDKPGLFTTTGVIVMQPENTITTRAKYGSAEDAKDASDTITETGNLLVGAWDRVLREEIEGHGHLKQADTFIGNPWTKPEEKIKLDKNEQLVVIPYQVTLGSYPPFSCGVVFPTKFFDQKSETDTQPDQSEQAEDQQAPDVRTEQTVTDDSDTQAQNVPTPDLAEQQNTSASQKRAKDIMQTNLIWADAKDTVQKTMTKIEAAAVNYALVGAKGKIEGIVATSDLTAAMSPYLRPVFAKWRRPLDDNTLQIKINQIMSSPVHTVNTDVTLTEVLQNMCDSGVRALPVLDQQGNAQGIITTFDIFNSMLKDNFA